MKTLTKTLALALSLGIAVPALAEPLSVYGYFSTRLGRTWAGTVPGNDDPAEFTTPSLNLMMQQQLTEHFKAYVNMNLASTTDNVPDSGVNLRNYWGEVIVYPWLKARLGKTYRRMGLYNEQLDAVPTYIGIEAPELFDTDHLIVSRTTAFMLHGDLNFDEAGNLRWAAMTDNGEGGVVEHSNPLGADLRWEHDGLGLTLGLSGYTSGPSAKPDLAAATASPKSGVLPWYATDHFNVYGGFIQYENGGLILQSEYWRAVHFGQRDAVKTAGLGAGALNANNRNRMLINPAGAVAVGNVRTESIFDIETWYVRAGYGIETSWGQFQPYLQWDAYSNPETVEAKNKGGDDEAGASDDGRFTKSTVGVVYRPIEAVAVKADQSYHFYQLNNAPVNYPEVRFDVSYTFGL